ncbi:hypothetical protein [Celeribacter sp. SCSIO 80788]|uniref:hypothetical protein n=1 Tax=Celeribacter sp. SCSIO 80788 TaxID=3117013 RepID=UPI003DA657C5
MSEFEGPPLKVVAMRTEKANRDFADWRVSTERQNVLARQLKEVPRSAVDDRTEGDLRFRSVHDGFEVAFMLLVQDGKFIVLVIGYDREGEMEKHLDYLRRSAAEALPPPVKTLLQGRKKKNER